MGGDEDSSAIVAVNDERTLPLSDAPIDPAVQQRWSELETIHLIAAYQEKWYLLKRGQLKARHWEEVANNIFLRMGGSEPSKSSVQCRHKIEKLRKRYRQEKQIEEQRGPRSSSWPFFEHMDAMERGRSITKLSPSSLTLARATSNGNSVRSNRLRLRWHDSSDKDYEPPASASKEARDTSPSKPRILGSVRLTTKLRQNAERNYVESPRVTLRPKVRRNYAMDDDCVSMDDKESLPDSSKLDCLSKRMNSELISVIRSLGEGFLKIEQMKLEMQRDNERLRADLELKRVGMLLDSQKEIAEMFTRALTGKKGVKKRQLQEL